MERYEILDRKNPSSSEATECAPVRHNGIDELKRQTGRSHAKIEDDDGRRFFKGLVVAILLSVLFYLSLYALIIYA